MAARKKLDDTPTGLTVRQLHAEFDKLRKFKEDRDAKKVIYDEADLLWHQQMNKVRDLSDSEGISGRLSTKQGPYEVPEPTWYATVQDWNAWEQWAKKNHPEMLRYDHHVTDVMNQLAREYADDGKEMPPGLGAYPKPVVKVFKNTKKTK
jgi:hypothetical protein